MNRHITKDCIPVASNQAHTPLVLGKIQIRSPAHPPRGKIEKTDNSKVDKDVEKLDPSNVAGGSVNW